MNTRYNWIYYRDYYVLNKDKIYEKRKKYYEENKTKICQKMAKTRAEKKQVSEKKREYKKVKFSDYREVIHRKVNKYFAKMEKRMIKEKKININQEIKKSAVKSFIVSFD